MCLSEVCGYYVSYLLGYSISTYLKSKYPIDISVSVPSLTIFFFFVTFTKMGR